MFRRSDTRVRVTRRRRPDRVSLTAPARERRDDLGTHTDEAPVRYELTGASLSADTPEQSAGASGPESAARPGRPSRSSTPGPTGSSTEADPTARPERRRPISHPPSAERAVRTSRSPAPSDVPESPPAVVPRCEEVRNTRSPSPAQEVLRASFRPAPAVHRRRPVVPRRRRSVHRLPTSGSPARPGQSVAASRVPWSMARLASSSAATSAPPTSRGRRPAATSSA
jgi:hypothetical protein